MMAALAARRLPARLCAIGGPLLAVAVALWLTAPAWQTEVPAGVDVIGHLVRVEFGVSELMAHGRLDGWFPRYYLGYQTFLVAGPGLTWLVGLVRAASLGALTTAAAFRVVDVGSFVAFPPAVAFLAGAAGLAPEAAGIAAVLSLLVSNPYGVGLHGLFGIGLVTSQIGGILVCLALGALLRLARAPRGRWVVLGAVCVAALLVVHVLSLVVLGLLVLVYLPWLVPGSRGLRALVVRLGMVAGGGLGLAGFWLVPFLAHSDLRGFSPTWTTPPFAERLRAIFAGEILFTPGVAPLVIVAWVVSVAVERGGRRAAIGRVVGPVACLLVAAACFRLAPQSELAPQLVNRVLGYVGVLATFPLAVLLGAAARRLGAAGSVAALGLATGLVVLSAAPLRELVVQRQVPTPALRAAARVLADAVPPAARFIVERDSLHELERTGVVHSGVWLARLSGRNVLNGFNAESLSTPDIGVEPDLIGKREPNEEADALARLGVTHVVTISGGLADRLAASGRFAVVWRVAPLAVVAVTAREGRPAPSSLVATDGPTEATLSVYDPEHLRFHLHSEAPTSATIAIAWSPKWHASLEGVPGAITRTRDGLIALDVAAGDSGPALDYAADAWDRVGVLVSALAVGAAMRWRKRLAAS